LARPRAEKPAAAAHTPPARQGRAFPPAVALAAAATILFWGSAFAGIRAGLHSYSPTHLALLRFLVASAALGIYALAARMRMPAPRDLPLVFLLGLLGFAFYNVALNIGETTIAAGPAALLIQTVPIWTALAATIFLGDRLRPFGWVGIAVGFSGAVVIALGKRGGFALGWGAGLVLLAAVSASAYNVIQKRMLGRYSPVQITTYAVWAGTLLLLPFAGGLAGEVRRAALADTLSVVYLGVFPAALGYVTWAYVLSKFPAARAASFLYGVPVTAFLVGWVWLGEVPTLVDVVGGLLALGGVAVVNTIGNARSGRAGGNARSGRAGGKAAASGPRSSRRR
jgi:drug/metabolite transporter (DMT)-like permease